MATKQMIRDVREAAGETQAEFARRFGVNQSTIHRWETFGPPTKGMAAQFIEQVLSAAGANLSRAEISKASQGLED